MLGSASVRAATAPNQGLRQAFELRDVAGTRHFTLTRATGTLTNSNE